MTNFADYQESPTMALHNIRNKLTVLQHNVNCWNHKRHALTNIYNQTDPDIIFLNDHSLTDDKRLKIFNYNVHQNNKSNGIHKGSAIAIKKDLDYKLLDDFETDLLAVTIESRQGPITIATDYIHPNSPFLQYIDYLSLLNRDKPV